MRRTEEENLFLNKKRIKENLNELITSTSWLKKKKNAGPHFPCCFPVRIDCRAEETQRKRRRKKGGAKSWGGPADERKTHGRDSFGEGGKK
jgi:hypothetical protein